MQGDVLAFTIPYPTTGTTPLALWTMLMAFSLSQFHIQLQEHSSMYHAHGGNDGITETCRMTFSLSQFHIQLPEHRSMYYARGGNDKITETCRMMFSLSQFHIQL